MVKSTNSINIDEKLKKYIHEITSHLSVDQIILFGSFAKGNYNEYSDIDLAVVSSELDSNKSGLYNLRKVKEITKLIDPDLQLVVFPTDVFESETSFDKYFIKEIKQTGKVIYLKH